MKIIWLPFLAVAFIGCDQKPASVPPVLERVANAKELPDGRFEILLRYSITTSGGPCFNSSLFRTTTHHETNWLYVKTLDGALSADQIVLKAGVIDQVGDFTYPIEGLRGTVLITNGTMTVRLEQPDYADGAHPQGYVPYRLNGTYTVSTH